MSFVSSSRRLAALSACSAGVLAFVAGCNRLPPDVAASSAHASLIRTELEAAGGGAAAGAAVSTETPTGWATLKGTFKLTGAAPVRSILPVDKEKEVCAPGGMQVLGEELVVDANGGIKDVLLFVSQKISPDEPWTHPSAKPGATEPVLFDQKACVFLSHVLALQVSQPLQVKNSDPVGHNASMNPKNNGGYNQLIPNGETVVYAAKKEEESPFSVACSIHPWMKAWIIFRGNSYFAVSKPDGSFEIPNLPAGVELEFRAWQEKANFLPKMSIDGAAAKVSKGKFKMKLAPNETKELQVTLDSDIFK